MIDIQVPSIRPEGLRRLAESMKDIATLGATLSVSYGKQIVPENFSEFKFMRFIRQPETLSLSGIPSMAQLRRSIHKLGVNQHWMIFDDDDYLTPASTQYLFECVDFMKMFEYETKMPCFLGTAGFFGSNHHGDRIHISPTNAIMPKDFGLIFSPTIDFSDKKYGVVDICYGGLEEALFCTMATAEFNAVPFKRFQNPSKTKIRKESEKGSSTIHNYDLWVQNSMQLIRHMSGDPKWIYPEKMGAPGTKSPKPFIKRAKELAEEYGL